MKVAILGRTQILVETARRLREAGHTISIIGTCKPHDSANELEQLAQEAGCEFFDSNSINSDPLIEKLRTSKCDIAVSINWNGLLSESVLNVFKHGVLNAHAGDLPRYRGNACVNWAILNGEQRIGLCIHKMVAKLDAGPIYQRAFFPLDETTYVRDVYDWLTDSIPQMFVEALKNIERGDHPEQQPADQSLSLRCYPRRPEDSRIRWNEPAEQIQTLIRASSRPFSGAFCHLEDGRIIRIWAAQVFKPVGSHVAMPGQYCFKDSGYPVFACGTGFLKVTDASIDDSSDDALTAMAKSVRLRLLSHPSR